MTAAFPPEWVKDAVFYQIFPDRFARSATLPKPANLEPWDTPPTHHGFKGGDLVGIAERLDYLQDLGITALYLTPVFQSAANHRYQTHDYYQVDPLLGGNPALRRLLDEAHRRRMRVVLDGVFNHCGRGLYQFHHILENGAASPYLDWFSVKSFPLHAYDDHHRPNYECWWNLRALPKFNTSNPAVREFLWGVGEHWVNLGIDGWRLDVPQDISHPSFWQEFRSRVKAVNPDAYLVGEIWRAAPDWLRGDRFDAVMNYPFATACLKFFLEYEVDPDLVRGMGYAQGSRLTASQFATAIHDLQATYPWAVNQGLLNLLDSHDTARFLTLARGDESALRLAVLFQMTYPGAPCIYYGDEIGMVGRRDPDCRQAFPPEEGQWNLPLRDHVKKCIALRHAHPALRRGEYATLYAADGVYSFTRRLPEETLLIALNVSRSTRTFQVPAPEFLPEGSVLRDVWSPEAMAVNAGTLQTVLPPRTGRVWLAKA